jgi:hypothetical protein
VDGGCEDLPRPQSVAPRLKIDSFLTSPDAPSLSGSDSRKLGKPRCHSLAPSERRFDLPALTVSGRPDVLTPRAASVRRLSNHSEVQSSRPTLSEPPQTQFEAYGVSTTPGLGDCRWQSLRTIRWKRQPVLRRVCFIDNWTSAQWTFRPQ